MINLTSSPGDDGPVSEYILTREGRIFQADTNAVVVSEHTIISRDGRGMLMFAGTNLRALPLQPHGNHTQEVDTIVYAASGALSCAKTVKIASVLDAKHPRALVHSVDIQ